MLVTDKGVVFRMQADIHGRLDRHVAESDLDQPLNYLAVDMDLPVHDLFRYFQCEVDHIPSLFMERRLQFADLEYGFRVSRHQRFEVFLRNLGPRLLPLAKSVLKCFLFYTGSVVAGSLPFGPPCRSSQHHPRRHRFRCGDGHFPIGEREWVNPRLGLIFLFDEFHFTSPGMSHLWILIFSLVRRHGFRHNREKHEGAFRFIVLFAVASCLRHIRLFVHLPVMHLSSRTLPRRPL